MVLNSASKLACLWSQVGCRFQNRHWKKYRGQNAPSDTVACSAMNSPVWALTGDAGRVAKTKTRKWYVTYGILISRTVGLGSDAAQLNLP